MQGIARFLRILNRSLMIGSVCSLEGGRQDWKQEDQRERSGPI